MNDQQVIAWAEREIRDLDELCRSQLPGYDPLDSSEMQMLKQLKKLAVGEEAPTSIPDHEALLRDAEALLTKMDAAFTALDLAKVKEHMGELRAMVVNRERPS